MKTNLIKPLILGAALLCGSQVEAQMFGGADSAYGTNGLKTVDFGTNKDFCSASVMDRFGRMWLGGYNQAPAVNSAFTRLDTLGKLSSTFKDNGISVIDFNPNGNEGIFAMAIDANDRVYAVGAVQGAASTDLLVFRMNIEGVIDHTFGQNGAVVHEITVGSEVPHSIVIDENNRPVIMGTANQMTSDIFVIRLAENGDRDSSFSGDGVVFFDPHNASNTPAGIAVRPLSAGGGYYVLCYQSQVGGNMATLISVSKNGNLNIDLGGPGQIDFRKSGFNTTPQDLLYIAGDLYIGGTFKGANGNQDAFISCIQANGKLKTTYGDSGSVVTTLTLANLDHEAFFKMVASADSSIFAVGLAEVGADDYVLTAHYDKNGNKEGLFGNGGGYHKTMLPNGASEFLLSGIQVDDKRGRLYVSGSANSNADVDFFAYAFITKPTVSSGPNSIVSVQRESLGVFPNPSSGNLYLSDELQGEVQVYALNGQLLANLNSENGKIQLPQHLDNGVYIVRLVQENTVYSTKINLIR